MYCRLRLLYHNRGRMLTTPTADDALRSQDLGARTAALSKQFDTESTSPEQKQYRELAMMYLNHGMTVAPPPTQLNNPLLLSEFLV